MIIPPFISANRHYVYQTTAFAKHQVAHPIEEHILRDAIAMAVIDTPTWAGNMDLGRVIGVCDQVATDVIDLDTVVTFARRKNRRTPTRCIVGESTPTTFLTVVVKGRVKPNEHSLITAYKGPWASPEPLGIDDQPALDYWCKNALVWVPEQYEEEPFESTWREVLSKKQF